MNVSSNFSSAELAELQNALIAEPAMIAGEDQTYFRGRSLGVTEYTAMWRAGVSRGAIEIDGDLRNLCENIIVSAIRQFFPHKREIKICSIASGDCFQELVVHAVASKLQKVVHWVLVDPKYYTGAGIEYTGDNFKPLAQALSPETRVTRVGHRAHIMFAQRAIQDIDLFFDINGAITIPPSNEVSLSDLQEYMQAQPQRSFAVVIKDYGDRISPTFLCEGANTPIIQLAYQEDPALSADLKRELETTSPLRKAYKFSPPA